MSRHALIVICSVAAAAAPAAAAALDAGAATVTLSGIEVRATPTVGTFVGKGRVSSGARVAWKAVVKHTRLRAGSGRITGGSFAIGSLDGGRVTRRSGAFAGGTIRLAMAAPGCGKQRFAVAGRLERVTGPAASTGTGTITISLTHYRHRLLGRCVTYAASVTGSVSLVGGA